MQTNARTVVAEVRYLPDLEIRTHTGTGEELHEIIVKAGRSSVRVLHWESSPSKDAANDQYRYNQNDHLGSCALELDSDGKVISQEWYHAFGTTAGFAGRGEVEASYKTVRYSGKERDATGLYYYGFRYYVPWLQRWVNPDPAAGVDGMNFYSMVGNSPLNQRDDNGLVGTDVNDKAYFKSRGISNVRGIEDYKIKHPKIADNVVKGIAGAIESLELSIAKLQSKDDHGDVVAVLQDYLGDSTDSRVDLYKASEELVSIFERARDGLLQHQSDNYKNILLVDSSTNDVFFTYPGDSRIYMTFRANDRANGFTFARAFAHEITHSLEISNDIWAVNHKVLRLAVLGDKSDQDDERAASAKIALNPKFGSMFDAETFMVSVDGWFSSMKVLFQGRGGALESSLKKFKENESIRRKVIFSNAASLESMMHALTAREVHRRLLPFVPLS
jgi:RHS repeat-associated protein